MRSVMIFNREYLSNQYLKRSLASVQQNRVLSRLHFAERSYVNTIYREQFHESIIIWLGLEKHLSS